MSKCEELCYESLKLILRNDVEVIRNYRPDWLKNPKTSRNLELDFYIPKMKVGIEIQGEHHYEDEYQKWKDEVKREACKKEEVILIELSIIQISPRVIHSKIETNLHSFGLTNRLTYLKYFNRDWVKIDKFDKYKKEMKKICEFSFCIKGPYYQRDANKKRIETIKSRNILTQYMKEKKIFSWIKSGKELKISLIGFTKTKNPDFIYKNVETNTTHVVSVRRLYRDLFGSEIVST